ncbi:ester cyclase [Natronomonas marina]|jgi:predicted ester cyclase|uniref:ester cyclase n=1 Tax=Natronomonas marina TaxID=2961939 RepID=UPI0020CA0032|nr:nuclear transport factor 2 family protein [Natronomonas marina]
MSETEHIETIRASVSRHNDPETREQYLDDYADEFELHGADADGLEELRAFYRRVWEAIPDLTVTVESVLADGDEVAVRYSWEGTHAVTGETVSLDDGLTWYRFEDGEIVERWVAPGTGATIRNIVEP